jgi:hypothetical protein
MVYLERILAPTARYDQCFVSVWMIRRIMKIGRQSIALTGCFQ